MREKVVPRQIVRSVGRIYAHEASIVLPLAILVFTINVGVGALLSKSPAVSDLLSQLIGWVTTAVLNGMVVALVANVRRHDERVRVAELFRAVRPVLGKLIVVSIIATIGTAVGIAVFLIPGLILFTIWSVVVPVVVLERPSGFSSFQRSQQLVRNFGRPVFIVVFALVIVVDALVVGATAIARTEPLALSMGLRAVADAILVPLSAICAPVLYFELLEAKGVAATDVAAR